MRQSRAKLQRQRSGNESTAAKFDGAISHRPMPSTESSIIVLVARIRFLARRADTCSGENGDSTSQNIWPENEHEAEMRDSGHKTKPQFKCGRISGFDDSIFV